MYMSGWLVVVPRYLPISLNVVSISSSPIANLGNGNGICVHTEMRLQDDNGHDEVSKSRAATEAAGLEIGGR